MLDRLETLLAISLPHPWHVVEIAPEWHLMSGTRLVAVFKRYWDAELVRMVVQNAHDNMGYQHVMLKEARNEIQELEQELDELTSLKFP